MAMLSHDEIVSVIKETALKVGEYDLQVLKENEYTIVSLQKKEGDISGTVEIPGKVRISTNGVEAFFLDCDGMYVIREFDHQASGQREILNRLVLIAATYLNGGGEIVVHKIGPLRRERHDMVVEIEGEKYILAAH